MIKNKFELDYYNLLKKIISDGEDTQNRTGVDTVTKFGEELTIDLTKGFPLITGKQMFFEKAYHEFWWILQGGTTTEYLKKYGIHWWDEFADEFGSLGKTYGYQIRNFNGTIDQMNYVYSQINQNTRRACVTLWNPSELSETNLPPCYTFFNFVRINEKLNMSVTFRSSDAFLGLPYDCAVLALYLINVAKFCNLKPNLLKLNLDNVHLYRNHTAPLFKYLNIIEDCKYFDLPKYNSKTNKIEGYKHGPFIKAKLNN